MKASEVIMLNLTVDVKENKNEYFIQLKGEIDVYTAPELKKQLLPLTEKEGVKIQIDLLHTTYLDSTGLGVFISAYKTTQQNNSELELIHVNERVLRLFKVTGLDKILNLKESKMSRGNESE